MSEYAENLYKPENIIGYTGDINKDPTVYFQKGDHNGHITQNHKNEGNIGRDIVLSSPSFEKDIMPSGVLIESIKDEAVHVSRNTFVKLPSADELKKSTSISKKISTYRKRKKLAKSIDKFKNLKPNDYKSHKFAKDQAPKGLEIENPTEQKKAMVQFEMDLMGQSKSMKTEINGSKMEKFMEASNKSLITSNADRIPQRSPKKAPKKTPQKKSQNRL